MPTTPLFPLPEGLEMTSISETYARLTKRLRTSVQEIGFATCGKGGESLGNRLGMHISDATLLWSLFLVPLRCQLARCISSGLTTGAGAVASASAAFS